MSRKHHHVLAFVVLLLAGRTPAQEAATPRMPLTITSDSVFCVTEVIGGPKPFLVTIEASGLVRSHRMVEGGKLAAISGSEARIEYPRHALVAFVDLEGNGRPQLVTATPRGIESFEFDDDGKITDKPKSLTRRARFLIRTGSPSRSSFVRDVNADGRPDVIVPGNGACELWLNRKSDAGLTLEKVAAFNVAADVFRARRGSTLSEVMLNQVVIPDLDLRDRNGDGRDDLFVQSDDTCSFFMQAQDGSIPADPSLTVDLSVFRDTSPESEIRPGRTLAGGDRRRFEAVDLDGDGISDYIVGHRHKIWVFGGTTTVPDFNEPRQILKTSDDITMLLTDGIDDDGHPDLLIVRVEIPSVGALLGAFFGEWEVEIAAIAYANDGKGHFASEPFKKSTLLVRMPSLRDILRDPEAIIARFEEASDERRLVVEGDLDGDGKGDVAIVTKDGTGIEAWRGRDVVREGASVEGDQGLFRRVFFDDQNKEWNLDRIIDFIANRSERRIAALIEGREKAREISLRPPQQARLIDLRAADIDGDGKAELIASYEVGEERRGAVDVLR